MSALIPHDISQQWAKMVRRQGSHRHALILQSPDPFSGKFTMIENNWRTGMKGGEAVS